MVHRGGPGRAGPCARDGRGRQRHRRHLPGDRQALREVEARWNAEKAAHRHFESEDHPINLNIGKIEGGDWASSVPAWCRIHCRIALYPGVTAAQAAAEIEAAVATFSRTDPFLANSPPRVVFNGFFAEGYVLEEGSEAEAVLGRAHERAIGSPLQSFMTRAISIRGSTPSTTGCRPSATARSPRTSTASTSASASPR